MRTATVSSLAVEYLRRIGVDFVFGVPGRSINPLLEELAFGAASGDGRPSFVMSRHEAVLESAAIGIPDEKWIERPLMHYKAEWTKARHKRWFYHVGPNPKAAPTDIAEVAM